MIEAGLYIAAGFLAAVLIAMSVAPAIWRRAVWLTQKRIEDSVPLGVAELEAGKDRLRAEHAVALQRLEAALRKQRERATGQAAQISDLTQTLRQREETIGERDGTIATLSGQIAELRQDLQRTESELVATQLDLDTANVSLSGRSAELETTAHRKADAERMLARARDDLDDRDRQIVALEERLGETREKLRVQQGQARESRTEARQTAELLKTERARSAELDRRLERSIQHASDLEAKLARREQEIVRLREARAGEEEDLQELERRALDAEEERASLERELGELTVRLGQFGKAFGDRDPEAVIAGHDATVARLETDLKRERARAEALERQLEGGAVAPGAADTELREEIKMIAAELVHMAAVLEGDNSPIPELVAHEPDGAPGRPVSLAARIRALQRRAGKARAPQSRPQQSGERRPENAETVSN